MSNYKLTVQYDGSRYKGWQRLGNTEDTVQNKIEKVLSIFAGEPVEVIGSGRTDAGVHAIAQIACFKIEGNRQETEIKQYLNQYLPDDISITNVESVPERFHARYNALSKTYLYKIWNNEHPNPFMRRYSMHVPEKLDVDLMRKATRFFIGPHDFTAFSNARSKTKSMVRTIHFISIEEHEGFLEIRICGDGFLHNMVRKITGYLIGVGNHTLIGEEIPEILDSKDRSRVTILAEACGLYLEEVTFHQNSKGVKR